MTNSAYLPGEPWLCCDRCGVNGRRSEMAKEWTGFMVHRATCWDPRPPELDPPNVYPEGLPIADARPEPDDVTLGDNDVQPEDL